MAWHTTKFIGNAYNASARALTLATLTSAIILTGCNVGKSDTVEADGTTTTTSTVRTCMGIYTGRIEAPTHEVRIANRNRQLASIGYKLTGNDAIDNKATGGGGVDGGIYLLGAFEFETDVNCNVIKNKGSNIFGIPITISGKVNPDLTFNLYAPQSGPVVGKVDANNVISGQAQEGGKTWVHGVMVGTFTPNGKF